MLNKIIEWLSDVTRPAITSLSSAGVGTVLSIDQNSKPFLELSLQYMAWTVAIIAGCIAILNGADQFYSKHFKKDNK